MEVQRPIKKHTFDGKMIKIIEVISQSLKKKYSYIIRNSIIPPITLSLYYQQLFDVPNLRVL